MRLKRVALALGSSVCLALVPAIAWADEAPSTREPSASVVGSAASKDIVRFKDGDIVRGTILESTSGESVTIQLATGEIRTVLWSETSYVGPEQRTASVDAPASDKPPAVKKQLRSSAALTVGIVAAVTSQISLAVAMLAWFDQKSCEQDRDFDAFRSSTTPFRANQTAPECSNAGTITAALVATPLLLGAGIGMILYGAKRVPIEKEAAVRFVPWTRGTTGAGGSLQLGF